MTLTLLRMRVEAEAFEKSFTELFRALKRGGLSDMISEANVQRYSHGIRWNLRANPQTAPREMEVMAVEWEIPFDRIIEGDLSLIGSTLEHLAQESQAVQMRSLYKTLSDTADKSGQTVAISADKSQAEAFLEMLKRIEFSVDREGNVSLPQIHAHPEMAESLMRDVAKQPPEFTAEVERVKAEKSEAALLREKARLARFKRGVSECASQS